MSFTAVIEVERPAVRKFRIRHLPSLLAETFKCWNADDPWRLSAVVAYYAVLSLPGLMVIIINAVGAIWGPEIVQGNLTDEIGKALGPETAEAVKTMVANTQGGNKNLISTIIGIGVLLFGATGVFYQLQISLNQVWQIRTNPDAGWLKMVLDRARSFAFILVMGFLLLVSFLVTTAIAVLSGYVQSIFPEFSIYVAFALNFGLSLAIISLLFALMFKYMPDAIISWKSVWVGALITALLFVFGKFLLGLYFGAANPGSTYGAAGSVVLILLWVSYSCLILFFGAEFTWVYSKRYGLGVRPKSHAMLVHEEEVIIEKGSDLEK